MANQQHETNLSIGKKNIKKKFEPPGNPVARTIHLSLTGELNHQLFSYFMLFT